MVLPHLIIHFIASGQIWVVRSAQTSRKSFHTGVATVLGWQLTPSLEEFGCRKMGMTVLVKSIAWNLAQTEAGFKLQVRSLESHNLSRLKPRSARGICSSCVIRPPTLRIRHRRRSHVYSCSPVQNIQILSSVGSGKSPPEQSALSTVARWDLNSKTIYL